MPIVRLLKEIIQQMRNATNNNHKLIKKLRYLIIFWEKWLFHNIFLRKIFHVYIQNLKNSLCVRNKGYSLLVGLISSVDVVGY